MPPAKKKTPTRANSSAHPKRAHGLSKSRFCTGTSCLKALYFEVHQPELAFPTDAAKQIIFDQGTQVGIEARKRYPGGLLIDQDHLHSKEALEATEEALAQNPPALFEAAFHYHNTLVRIDILKNNGDGTWDIIEVKSSTKLKEEHQGDIAIQRYVAEGAGIKVRRTILKHLNRECVFPNLENLFIDADCTNEVKAELEGIEPRIEEMLSALEASNAPEVEIGPHCEAPYECSFKKECWAKIPSHSVFELHGVREGTKFELYQNKVVLIRDIPKGKKISYSKPQQIQAVQTMTPVIDISGLKSFLNELQYPISFFDFETINPAMPWYRGLHPYDFIPFQYSCHILDKEGAKPRHLEYLADGSKDPRKEVAERLLTDLGTKGTILAYNQSFEKGRIKELAEQFPALSNRLLTLIPRFKDLKDAFSKHYYHPDFHGSFSIKDVLPVLVPTMTYEEMGVSEGGEAQVAYLELCDLTTSTEDRVKWRKHLLEYCKQDTLAMVELLSQIRRIVNGRKQEPD